MSEQAVKAQETFKAEVSFKANAFWVIYEIANAIAQGVEWDKEARIVLAYDPRKENATLTVTQPQAESGCEESQAPAQ